MSTMRAYDESSFGDRRVMYSELRAENAKLKADLEKAYAQHDPAMLKMLDRAEKAELDLKVAKHETKMAQEAALWRDADVAALREGLFRLCGAVDGLALDFPYLKACKHEARLLLASPDPGAKVRAVVLAGKRIIGDLPETTWQSGSPYDDLQKAVRALRGKEGEVNE